MPVPRRKIIKFRYDGVLASFHVYFFFVLDLKHVWKIVPNYSEKSTSDKIMQTFNSFAALAASTAITHPANTGSFSMGDVCTNNQYNETEAKSILRPLIEDAIKAKKETGTFGKPMQKLVNVANKIALLSRIWQPHPGISGGGLPIEYKGFIMCVQESVTDIIRKIYPGEQGKNARDEFRQQFQSALWDKYKNNRNYTDVDKKGNPNYAAAKRMADGGAVPTSVIDPVPSPQVEADYEI